MTDAVDEKTNNLQTIEKEIRALAAKDKKLYSVVNNMQKNDGLNNVLANVRLKKINDDLNSDQEKTFYKETLAKALRSTLNDMGADTNSKKKYGKFIEKVSDALYTIDDEKTVTKSKLPLSAQMADIAKERKKYVGISGLIKKVKRIGSDFRASQKEKAEIQAARKIERDANKDDRKKFKQANKSVSSGWGKQ